MEDEDIVEVFDDIFDNNDEVIGNIKSAAEDVGLPQSVIENIDKEKPKKVHYAKKSCTWCCGRGILDFVPNGVFIPSRRTEPSKAFLKSVKYTKRKLARSMRALTELTSGKIKPGRNTCLPEEFKNREWRNENVKKVLCKCVRTLEEA